MRTPVVAEERIHFGATDHMLHTLKADDGRLRWKLETGGEITGSPVVQCGPVRVRAGRGEGDGAYVLRAAVRAPAVPAIPAIGTGGYSAVSPSWLRHS